MGGTSLTGGFHTMRMAGIAINSSQITFSLLLLGVMCTSVAWGGELPRSGSSTPSADAKQRVVVPKMGPPAGKFGGDNPLPIATATRKHSIRKGMKSSGFGDLVLLLFYVFILVSVLWGGLALFKKYIPGARQMFASPGMEVLGRTHIDPRRYVAILRVGRRLLVLGITPDGMEALTEIEDEVEVAELLEVTRPKSEAGMNLFQKLFTRHLSTRDKADDRAIARSSSEELGDSISSLRERVKSRRENEK